MFRFPQVEKWISYGEEKLGKTADFKSVGDVADELDRYMTLRSFFVGYRLTAADFAMYGALRSGLPPLCSFTTQEFTRITG